VTTKESAGERKEHWNVVTAKKNRIRHPTVGMYVEKGKLELANETLLLERQENLQI
jgi:hypothetical protein